jgi:hypothetical protein
VADASLIDKTWLLSRCSHATGAVYIYNYVRGVELLA